MDADDVAGKIAFLTAEQDLAVRFGIPAEALVPLFFSLRFGGDYSYADASVRTISVLKKTTVYDADQQQGYTHEEIFLFVNPVLAESEGTVHRMEKCGDEPERLLVTRPYRVRVRADRILKLTVNPLARTITPGELSEKEMVFVAPTAYDVVHELEHLQNQYLANFRNRFSSALPRNQPKSERSI